MKRSTSLAQKGQSHSLGDPIQTGIPFNPPASQPDGSALVNQLNQKIIELEEQLRRERTLNQELINLDAFNHEVEGFTGRTTGAQLAANTLASSLHCPLALILSYDADENRLTVLASAGSEAAFPTESLSAFLNSGFVLRTIQTRHPMIFPNDAIPHEPVEIDGLSFSSMLICPLSRRNYLEGAILLASYKQEAFTPVDLTYVESLGARLSIVWDNNHNRKVLAELAESLNSLATAPGSRQILERVAEVACHSAKATFAIVTIRGDEGEWLLGTSGKAPLLLANSAPNLNQFIEEIIKASAALRIGDISSDPRISALTGKIVGVHSLLSVPMTLDYQVTGAIMVFGRRGAAAFLEEDEFFLNLLANQAVISIERCYLDQELRSTLKSTQLFYDLSMRVAESDDLTTAAHIIGLTAYRLFQARNCGLMLYTEDGSLEASVLFPADDLTIRHPERLIRQAMRTGELAYQGKHKQHARLAIPIQTARRCYGALWLDLGEANHRGHRPVEEVRILINQSAVALERSILLTETRQQARQIAMAYHKLEDSYDMTLLALTNALDARDHETELHTQRVATIALGIGREMGLTAEELVTLKRGALLHDIGKIGITDGILRKAGKLNAAEWSLMQKHPSIGAEIVNGIPSLEGALTIIANHHERWNGSGYPLGLVGEETPLLARIFIVADVYDALTSHRPYRSRDFSHEDAIEYIQSQSGVLFDPVIVQTLCKILQDASALSELT